MSATLDRGPMGEATLAASRPVSPETRLLTVVPTVRHPWRAGQVVEVAIGAEPGAIFAIASAPSEGPALSLLVKGGGGVSGRLNAAPVGTPVRLSEPFGPGFRLPCEGGRDLLLIGAGTGVAPLRAVLVEVLARRSRWGRLALVHGVRTPAQRYVLAEHRAWRQAGVKVREVVSRPEPKDGWQGATGHVQAHLADLVTPGCLALVVGSAAMETEVRRALIALGVAPEDVRHNH